MNINSLVNVLPEESILLKESVGFIFYESEYLLKAEQHFSIQHCTETFQQFIERTVHELIKKEEAENVEYTVRRNYEMLKNETKAYEKRRNK